jgi:hypothetical protein
MVTKISYKKGSILGDSQYIYHGTSKCYLYLVKTILKEGIKPRSQYSGAANRAYNVQSDDLVSCSLSPAFSELPKSSFGIYTGTSISLVIKPNYVLTLENSGAFPDEVFTAHINPNCIKGVMVPSELLDKPLKKLPIFTGENVADLTITKAKIKLFLETSLDIFNDYKFVTPELLTQQRNDLLDQASDSNSISDIENALQEFHSNVHINLLSMLNIENSNPTMKEILRLYIPKELPIYSSDGLLIKDLPEPQPLQDVGNRPIVCCWPSPLTLTLS